MVAIINRTPTGRIISLHAEIRYLFSRFHEDPFSLNGIKFDQNSETNQLQFFHLAKEHSEVGLYDPYLDNPLSLAKFHLTQSIQYDTQKSKSASECANALEALGWIKRKNKMFVITTEGMNIASLDFRDFEFFSRIRSAVLDYGVFVGFLFKCKMISSSPGNVVIKDNIEIGYPNSAEVIDVDGRNIPISSGSQKDTIVRTRAALSAWAISTGFALPIQLKKPSKLSSWFVETLDEVSKPHWSWNQISVFIPDALFNREHLVHRPLTYPWMTKSTKALRERGQAEIRQLTLREEAKIKNRRFAIVYMLAKASEMKGKLNFQKLLSLMKREPDFFIVNPYSFENVMFEEREICITSGIPFEESGDFLIPLTNLYLQSIEEDAPERLLQLLNSYCVEVIVK